MSQSPTASLNESFSPGETMPVAQLKPSKANPCTHSNKQIKQIARSIERFGFTNAVLIDNDGGIIAGHGRVEAAKLLEITEVPVRRLSHLSPEEVRAYLIADNRIAEQAGWDPEILAIELQTLIDIDFDVELTGFEMGDIDVIIEDADERRENVRSEDKIPELASDFPISRRGDLWLLGQHRLLCGDARDDDDYQRLLEGEKAEMVFTDPPYNVKVDGHVCGKGSIHHHEFAMASGEMSPQAFIDFLTHVFEHLVAHSTDGSIHYQCMDWRHIAEMAAAGGTAYTELKNICVWVKTNGGMGSLYRSRHEFVFVWKSGTAPHANNVELGQHGRNRTNVWQYPGISSMGPGRLEELAMHPTVKPVALVSDAIKDCSRRNGIILDPFLGSGTTVVAAERTGRRARGIEIDPGYVDVTARRWQAFTGRTARLSATGQTFEEAEEERAKPSGQTILSNHLDSATGSKEAA